jgi:transcriptional regulator with XRE-family HTH domain
MHTTGEELRKTLETLGVSVMELEERSGLSRSTIYRVMSGDDLGSLHTWRVIAEALGVPTSELIGELDGR